MPNVFTIPPDLCFVSTLAAGLWRRVAGDPLALASYRVFLPTRRACRALREAFLRATGAKAALLPRMQPLGDVDEVELDFADAQALDTLPPAIPVLRRRMLLTQLVMKKDANLPLEQAASLADALGRLIDQTQTEGLDFAALKNLVSAEYATHWQETLRFLEIVTEAWPAILAKEGCLDPAARLVAVLDAQTRQWRENPPAFPVIAAGSTGSVPAVGRMMQAIADLPQGEVILPGLDFLLDEEAWQAIDDTHPQATMKSWLESAKIKRGDVRLWEGYEGANAPRRRLFSEALRPAEATAAWRDLTREAVPPEAAQGVERLDLDHHREEADVIALRLRAALEEPGKTAALVTSDRALAARVAAALGRWGIEANDSAGTPLSIWPVGSFLNAVLDAAATEASPVAYLALLKHPLAACGIDPAACRSAARVVERRVWRGVRLSGGWRGAARAMIASEDKDNPCGKNDLSPSPRGGKPESVRDEIVAWLAAIADAFTPLTQNWFKEKPLAEHVAAHLALAENLADTGGGDGPARLWRGESGEKAVAFFDDWREAGADFPPLTGEAYARLCAALMQEIMVRPVYGQHPRLSLLGPLEARLLHHDLVILGGLNEGVWPPAPPVDPWLSRPMKKAFGLPSPERRVGLSAHDFAQLACAPQVLLTRAKRVSGALTVPSRFLSQLETVLKAVSLEKALTPAQPWREWARALDAPERVAPMLPPSPRPPLAARPRRLSVTEIGTWLGNPYAIYARHVLRLEKLEDIDADIGAADRGSAIHQALETFLSDAMKGWPDDALKRLLEAGRRAFAPFADRPQVQAFWGPRFENIARWFVQQEQARRDEGIVPVAVEVSGTMTFRDGAFTLAGRADRIDKLADGRAALIDYKTGGVPTAAKVMAGYEPQLALLALIAQAGGFKALGPLEAGELSYWSLRGGEGGEKIVRFAERLETQQKRAREGLEELLARFSDPQTPYEAGPKPDVYDPRYDDYAHLARFLEWGRAGEGGEGGE